MGKFIVVKDSKEFFTQSTCNCRFCRDTHTAISDWNTFLPVTRLQARMLKVIRRIEKRVDEQIEEG